MTDLFALALSFPSVVYTVLLGVMLVYWLFVMAGVVHLGEGSEGALDGLGADGGLEGAAKGSLEGAAKGVLEADVGADGHHAVSTLAAALSALGLKAIPVTVSGSLVVTFSWMTSMVAMQLAARWESVAGSSLVGAGVLVAAPFVALPLSAIVARPLAKVFATRHAPSRSDLVGKTCVVRTGTVNQRFGEALLDDGGAGLVLRVRIDGDAPLKRGDHALIVDWDAERDAFLVEPLSELLRLPPSRRDGSS